MFPSAADPCASACRCMADLDYLRAIYFSTRSMHVPPLTSTRHHSWCPFHLRARVTSAIDKQPVSMHALVLARHALHHTSRSYLLIPDSPCTTSRVLLNAALPRSILALICPSRPVSVHMPHLTHPLPGVPCKPPFTRADQLFSSLISSDSHAPTLGCNTCPPAFHAPVQGDENTHADEPTLHAHK
jgi:hypothetical protein